MRLAVLVSGSGTNLQAILDAIAAGTLKADVVVVVSNKADAYGLQRADAIGIPTLVRELSTANAQGMTRREYDGTLAATLLAYSPDWVVLAGWMHLLSMDFLRHFPQRVINLHPALPGHFPGLHAIERGWAAYQAGDVSETGIMVHLVPDEGVDDGPVLATEIVPILPDDTYEAYETRLHAAEHRLLVAVLRTINPLTKEVRPD
ncbi:MAG: phosphoribosylglycinamide formyltransferase [Ardenticatenales bacterium]|nr:phosphoribosylglycinamide formyltransferase [Ardenticatenales bacterium]